MDLLLYTLPNNGSFTIYVTFFFPLSQTEARRRRDRMVNGFTTTCAIIAYHH
jgi:hypothetical protein